MRISGNPKFQAFDDDGEPLSGGKLYTYKAGTTTNKTAYSSYAGAAQTNPIILDSRGETSLFLSGAYKLKLTDSDDVPLWTLDNVIGPDVPNVYYSGTDIEALITTIGSTESILYVDDDSTLTGNLTTPRNVHIVSMGGIITIPNGDVLTINGSFEAGLWQCFNDENTDYDGVVFANGAVDYVCPEWWGVNTTPGTTDMSAHTQCACNSHEYVKFTGGIYGLKSISLNDNQHLFINKPATLKSLTDATAVAMIVITEKDGVTIEGEGTIEYKQYGDNHLEWATATYCTTGIYSTGCNDLKLRGFTLIGDDTNTDPKAAIRIGHKALHAREDGNVLIENLTVRDLAGWGVAVTAVRDVKITGCHFENIKACTGAGGGTCRAVIVGNTNRVSIVNNTFFDGSDTFVYAIDTGGADRVVITGNVIEQFFGGIDIENGNYEAVIANNTLNGSYSFSTEPYQGFGIFFNGVLVNATLGVIISGNVIEGFADGIWFNGAGDVNIIGNTICNNRNRAFIVYPESTGNISMNITGNTIRGNGLIGGEYEIYLVIPATDTGWFGGVFANNIVNCGTYGGGIKNKIRIAGVNDLTAWLVTGNYWDASTYVLSYCRASDNICHGTGTNEIAIPFAADDATPSVKGGHKHFITANANATTITGFDDGAMGQEIIVYIGDALTTLDFSASNLNGNGGVDYACNIGDVIRAMTFNGVTWNVTIIDIA